MKPIDFLEQAVTQTPTTQATPAQQAQLQAAQQQQAMGQARAVKVTQQLNTRQLQQLLPNIDPAKLTAAIKAEAQGKRTNASLQALGIAFADLYKSDPVTTTKVMNLLKKSQQLPPAQTQPAQSAISEGVWDAAKAALQTTKPYQAVRGAVQSAVRGAKAIGGLGQGVQGSQVAYNKAKINQLNSNIANNLYNATYKTLNPVLTKYKAVVGNEQAARQAAAKDIEKRIYQQLGVNNYTLERAQKLANELGQDELKKHYENIQAIINNNTLQSSILAAYNKDLTGLKTNITNLVYGVNTFKLLPGATSRWDDNDFTHKKITTKDGATLVSKLSPL